MNETNGTGVEYPQLTLGGKTYTLKITRGALMYRFSKRNIPMGQFGGPAGIAALADQLHAIIGVFPGEPEEILEMILAEDKVKEASIAVGETIKKAFPPPIQAATAADAPADSPVQ